MMEQTMAETRNLPKKSSKGRDHVRRAPKLGTPRRSLAEERAAHKETCIRLDAALARLQQTEQAHAELNAVVQPLHHCVSDLTAALKQKHKDLQLLRTQSAEAGGRASARLSDMLARLRAQEHRSQQQRSAAARELAAACDLAARDLAAHKQQAAEELSHLQLAHNAMLNKLGQDKQTADACVASLQQQLQNKDDSLTAAEDGKQAALSDLAAQQFAAQAATRQIAVLQKQLAVAQDSLEQLQDKHKAAQGDLAVQRAATAAAELRITDLELNSENLTASLSEVQHGYELLSADLAAHEAAAGTAESRIESLLVQLQDSNSRCAELQIAAQSTQDDLARQVSAAAAAANKVNTLERLQKDALAKLQQLQVAMETTTCQHMKAADAAAKAHRDKCAVRDAEIRACRWKLAKSEAGQKRLQHEAVRMHQQLAAAADGAIQSKVQLQTVVWGRTAAIMEVEEAETATQLVKRQLHAAQCKLADNEDKLFGWACADAATSIAATDVTSTSADPADGTSGSPAPYALVASILPSPRPPNHAQRSLPSPSAPGWEPVTLPPSTALPHRQSPASSNQEDPVSSCDEVPCLNTPAGQTLHTANCSTSSRRGTPLSNLCKPLKPLNKVFKRLGALCAGGFCKRSSSPPASGDMNQDPVLNSFMGSQPHTSTAPSPCMPLHGIADLVAERISAKAQECEHAAAEAAAAAAAVTGSESGMTGSTVVAAVPRLSRWGSAAAGAGDAGYSSPGPSDTAVGRNFIGSTSSQSSAAGGSLADLADGVLVTCDDDLADGVRATCVGNQDDPEVDGEVVTVTVAEKSADSKTGLVVTAAMIDVGCVVDV